MVERPLSILQVNTADSEGGAANVARRLFLSYRTRGSGSWLAVGRKRDHDPDVFVIPDELDGVYRTSGYRALQTRLGTLAGKFPGTGWGLLSRWLRFLTHPRALAEKYRGIEDFNFPGTYHLLDLTPTVPNIAHLHNLHGGYFDLRSLSWLCHRVPVILTLHDAWLLGGHCAHSLDCERWNTGCGHCPYLTIEPDIRRDATAYNWRRKREIYAASRLFVATPCHWLRQKVAQSILAPAIVESRVIPNGIDLSIFRPSDRRAARASLGIPQDTRVVLFVARNMRMNIWRNYEMIRATIALIAERLGRKAVLFVALGENGPTKEIGEAEVRFVPYQKHPQAVARYYQAADLYVHAAKVDTFPTTILEALACGTPVVATAVGGIPEQIKGLQISNFEFRTSKFRIPHLDSYGHGKGDATGVLVPPGDAEAMAEGVIALLTNDPLRSRLGENAAKDAKDRFNSERQVDAYLEWYQVILDSWRVEHSISKRNFADLTLPAADPMSTTS